MTFRELHLKQTPQIKKTILSENVQKFTELSDEITPVGLDLNYPNKKIFKEPTVHGFLYSSLISTI